MIGYSCLLSTKIRIGICVIYDFATAAVWIKWRYVQALKYKAAVASADHTPYHHSDKIEGISVVAM